jgi:hypothetical protein
LTYLKGIWGKFKVPASLTLTVMLTGLLITVYILGVDRWFEVLAEFQVWILGGMAVGLLGLYIPVIKTWKPEKIISRDESFMNNMKAKMHNTKRVFRRFSRNYRGYIGIVIIVFFGFVALFPGLFLPSETPQYSWMEYRDMDRGPSRDHPLGVTNRGNDVLTIVVLGARPVIIFALRAAVLAVSIGGVLGALAGSPFPPDLGTGSFPAGLGFWR